MADSTKGIQAMFPVYLPRQIRKGENREDYDTAVSQNENSLNQNFHILYQKLLELEAAMEEN